jgi:formate--tetrahydrofolate ligase
MSGLKPSAVVLVATIRALKFHGGIAKENLNTENLAALETGFANLERHYQNITRHYGLPCVICLNHFTLDTEAEVASLLRLCTALGATCVVSKHWANGGAGAEKLANEVIKIVAQREPGCSFVYDEKLSLWEKIEAIATKLYGASGISASTKVKAQLTAWDTDFGHFPICMAKTQMSFSTNPATKGAPTGHVVEISDVKLSNGAGFIVAIAGDMMTMPGLPKIPAAERIDIDDNGKITGLF